MSVSIGVKETFRKLARIVVIDDVLDHPNADKLSLAIVGGWQVCILLNEYKKGDKALYCEIDALVPTLLPEFAFLEERGDNLKEFNEQTYCRIKTIKLRKELSQGLLVPIPAEYQHLPPETNLTEELGILKHEKVSEVNVTAKALKNLGWFRRFAYWLLGPEPEGLPWPGFLNKSEENRVQNTSSQYARAVAAEEEFEVSYKLDGESLTVYAFSAEDGLKTGVCSRNTEITQEDVTYSFGWALRRFVAKLLLRNRRAIQCHKPVWPTTPDIGWKARLKEFWVLNHDAVSFNVGLPKWERVVRADSNYFLAFALKNGLLDKLRNEFLKFGLAYTLQGELIGPGIQGNYEGVKALSYYVYRVYLDGNTVLAPPEARAVCAMLGVSYIPLVSECAKLPPTIKDVLKLAEGKRALAKGGSREGVVCKSLTRNFSFKVVSNKYLLNEE